MADKHWDVVVIGAGFSGLIAARDLTERGLSVLVVEGRDRPGGRTWYREYEGLEQRVELGGTWIAPTRMPAIMAEVERYDIDLVEQADVSKFAWVTGGERRDHAPIPPAEFGAAELAMEALYAAMARTPNGDLIPGMDYSDLDVPVSEWPPFATLPLATREFVYAWASMYSGSRENEVSVMHFSTMLAAFGEGISALHYGLSHRFAHGTRSVIEAIEADLAAPVQYSTRVTAIHQGDSVTVRTDGGDISADRVICTVPVNALRRVVFEPALPGPAADMAARGTFSKSLKSLSHCRNFPEGLMGVGWGTGLEWAIGLYTLEDGTSIVCGFGHNSDLLDPADPASVQRALRHFAPDVEVLSVDTHSWNDDEYSGGTSMIIDPGWIASGDCHVFNEPHDRVYFAGSDHSLAWTGWIEGAVQSGRRVAARVADDASASRT